MAENLEAVRISPAARGVEPSVPRAVDVRGVSEVSASPVIDLTRDTCVVGAQSTPMSHVIPTLNDLPDVIDLTMESFTPENVDSGESGTEQGPSGAEGSGERAHDDANHSALFVKQRKRSVEEDYEIWPVDDPDPFQFRSKRTRMHAMIPSNYDDSSHENGNDAGEGEHKQLIQEYDEIQIDQERQDYLYALALSAQEMQAGGGASRESYHEGEEGLHESDQETRDYLYAVSLARHDLDGGSSSDPLSTSLNERAVKCPVCFDEVPCKLTLTLGVCGHTLCAECARAYLAGIADARDKYPIPCVQCAAPLDNETCLLTMCGTVEYTKLETFLVEKMHCGGRIRYCPNSTCSIAFEWVDDPALRGAPTEFQAVCPGCLTLFCVKCKTNWHEGMTCEAFQVLDKEDNALANLVSKKKWKCCPNCAVIVERRSGCNYMHCRCGQRFCYRCGVAYLSKDPTARNGHGSPGCSCSL